MIVFTMVTLFVVEIPIFLLSLVLDRRRRAMHAVMSAFGRFMVRANPFWRVRVQGASRLPPGRFIVTPNHQSYADILCLTFVRGQFRYLAKRSLFRIPFLGWVMAMGGQVAVDRRRHASGAQALERCRRWLEQGISVAIFPEGTRSERGELGPFKMGAFNLAVETQTPILPILITGTERALPVRGWVLRVRADIQIFPLDPVLPGGDAVALRETVRARLLEAKSGAETPKQVGS